MGNTTPSHEERRVMSRALNIAKDAEDETKRYCDYKPKQNSIIGEELLDMSARVLARENFTGDCDTIAYTSAMLAIHRGVLRSQVSLLLVEPQGTSRNNHMVAVIEGPEGKFVFGDVYREGLYDLEDMEHSEKYSVNMETGEMRNIINLQKIT